MVATRQLAGHGVSNQTIHTAVRGRFLFRAVRSVYSVGRPEVSIFGIWMACVLAAGEGAALAGLSAASAMGFEKRHVSPVYVVRPGHDGYRTRAHLKAHGHSRRVDLRAQRCRWLRDQHITRVRGIPTLHAEPALLQLAGQLDPERFQHRFWEADRIKGLDQRRLDACVEAGRGLKGAAVFREAVDCRLPHIDEALSLLETLLMALVRRENLPPPVINRTLEGHLVDFRWPLHGLVVEVDGYEFHRGRGAFERDAETDNDLRAAGWTVLRFTYRMLEYRPEYVKETILRALRGPAPT